MMINREKFFVNEVSNVLYETDRDVIGFNIIMPSEVSMITSFIAE